MNLLTETVRGIRPVSEETARIAQEILNKKVKSSDGLNKLEEIAVKIAAINGKFTSKLDKKCVVIFASDNGIYEEGVNAVPKIVTLKQTLNIAEKEFAAINVLSRQAKSDVYVIDLGIDADLECDKVINRKIRKRAGLTEESYIHKKKILNKVIEKRRLV